MAPHEVHRTPESGGAPPTAPHTTGTRGVLGLWHLLATALVVLAPMLIRFGAPFWKLPPELALQAVAVGVAYLSFAILLASHHRPTEPGSIVGVAALGAACWGATVFLLLVLPGFQYSRLLLATAGAMGIPLALAPRRLRGGRGLRGGVGVLAVAAGATCLWAVRVDMTAAPLYTVSRPPSSQEIVAAGAHAVQITRYGGLVTPGWPMGGGMDIYRDWLVVSNSVGQLYRIRWEGSSLRSEPLSLPPVLNRDPFIEDNSVEDEDRHFRVMDLLVDTVARPPRILVSHYAWHRKERCISLRLSTIPLPNPRAPDDHPSSWETLFDSRPCLPFGVEERQSLTNHAGGRMAQRADGRILFSVGDMLQEGGRGGAVLPQDPAADYGKVLLLGDGGRAELYSLGHRNPEGLTVGRDGSVWSTEHGPRGGDELNLVVAGGNYGWPIATYGTAQDQSPYPQSEYHHDHGPYREPVFAWVPSVGISSLIELGGTQFPDWEGDLVVGSLNGRSLFRLRIQGERVVYSERIEIGRRIRDLVEDASGRLVLYTDPGDLVVLENAGRESGGALFAIWCAGCHDPTGDGHASGPDLRGVFGRTAASLRGYSYSDAFRDLDVTWDEATLDRFLENPTGYVPGTAMGLRGLPVSDRAAVIDYLKGLR